jgi:hypothetical protein
MGYKYAGIQFRRHDDAGIAQISVYNTTKSEYVLEDALVDLYMAEHDDTNGEYELFTYWITLPYPDDLYTVEAIHSGSHNASCAGTDYSVEIEQYLLIEELTSAEIQTVLTIWDEDNSLDTYTYTLTASTVVDTAQTTSANGDGSEDTFGVGATNSHAAEFLEFSIDGGTTWKTIYSPDIYSWGSNLPDYDDETIDTDGHFWVVFVTPPATGTSNVKLKWKPKATTGKIVRTIKQPTDGINYYDLVSPVRLLDDAIEMI